MPIFNEKVMAGLGAALNTGNVGRGDSVAVIGCGGVGAAAIAGARAMSGNQYKIQVARTAVKRAILAASRA